MSIYAAIQRLECILNASRYCLEQDVALLEMCTKDTQYVDVYVFIVTSRLKIRSKVPPSLAELFAKVASVGGDVAARYNTMQQNLNDSINGVLQVNVGYDDVIA